MNKYKLSVLVAVFALSLFVVVPAQVLAETSISNTTNSEISNKSADINGTIQAKINALLEQIRTLQAQMNRNTQAPYDEFCGPGQCHKVLYPTNDPTLNEKYITIKTPAQDQVYGVGDQFTVTWSGGNAGESLLLQIVHPEGFNTYPGFLIDAGAKSFTWYQDGNGYPRFINTPGKYSLRFLKQNDTIQSSDDEVMSQTVNFTVVSATASEPKISIMYPNIYSSFRTQDGFAVGWNQNFPSTNMIAVISDGEGKKYYSDSLGKTIAGVNVKALPLRDMKLPVGTYTLAVCDDKIYGDSPKKLCETTRFNIVPGITTSGPKPVVSVIGTKTDDFEIKSNRTTSISGQFLSGDGDVVVTIDGKKAKVTRSDDDRIEIEAPRLTSGTTELVVITENGISVVPVTVKVPSNN